MTVLDREYLRFLILKGLLQKSFQLAHRVFPEGGTCLEFGVFRGSSYIYQAEQIVRRYPNSKLVGFDSWAGLPEETAGVWAPKVHEKGQYRSTKDVVLERMKKAGIDSRDPRFSFVDGFYHDSLTPALQKSFQEIIFINIDVDIHKSTIELLDFIKPMLQPGTILYWDDWKSPLENFEGEWGEHLAWEQWSAENPRMRAEVVDVNWVQQRTMVVTAVGDRSLSAAEIARVHTLSRELDSLRVRVGKQLLSYRAAQKLLQLAFRVLGAFQTTHGEPMIVEESAEDETPSRRSVR